MIMYLQLQKLNISAAFPLRLLLVSGVCLSGVQAPQSAECEWCMSDKHDWDRSWWTKPCFCLFRRQNDSCASLAVLRWGGARAGLGERLRRIGWLLITAVLLSMLKHAGSRWAGSLWLSERESGWCGRESEGERATETPTKGGRGNCWGGPRKVIPG